MNTKIWIVDFGSQYTQLITRKTREQGFSSEIITYEECQKRFYEKKIPRALILSGGPSSVFEDQRDFSFLFSITDLPILGICYGMQIMGHYFKGVVEKGIVGEYGHAEVIFENRYKMDSVPNRFSVWMSHSDHVKEIPKDFECLLKSTHGLVAGIKHKTRPLMGLQFHPEVEHSKHGKFIIEYFCKEIAKLAKDWTPRSMIDECSDMVKRCEDKNVLCAFSGGVDSLVAATLSSYLLKEQLHCFFVDNGLLRIQDYRHIECLKKETKLKIEIVDAKEIFLTALRDVIDPEEKRKIIGRVFIDIFHDKVVEYQENHGIKFTYLLQGTLYPDVIESLSPHGKSGASVTIKSHHNVGGLPEKLNLKLLEPLRCLFKDEVREMGLALGLKREWVFRHPFPGPGMGVRILGEVNAKAIEINQKADQILFEELIQAKLYHSTWQAFTVFLPVKTVGVKGDGRAYENVICLRMVNSSDGMTANWTHFPYEFLENVSSRITNEVPGITRVVYDITSKPPGTIEWE